MQIKHIYILFFSLLFCNVSSAKIRPDTLMLSRIFNYVETIDTSKNENTSTYSYQKSSIVVNRRNFTLLAVPSMYVIAHGGNRKYITETYDHIQFENINNIQTKRINTITTIPHHRKALPTLLKYLTPNIYNGTIIEDHILSPFNRDNKIYYRYKVSFLLNGTVKISFRPRGHNTQLVKGMAIADYNTGRILRTELIGEFDMINFDLQLTMGNKGTLSLIPTKCMLNAQFNFLGNRISTNYTAYYGIKKDTTYTVTNAEDYNLMVKTRPDTLTDVEHMLYEKYIKKESTIDTMATIKKKKDSKFKKIMWDVIGDHMVNRIRSKFGQNDKGYIRIDPLVNPLYMGYSHRKGITYKIDMRGEYDFSENSDIFVRFKSGYSFKQKQFYYNIPIKYNYDKKRDGYIQFEFGNGNRIFNSTVSDKISNIDTLMWDKDRLNAFNDQYLKLVDHHNISNKLGIQLGFIYHKREAVDKEAFVLVQKTDRYISFAPLLELEFRPLGWKGPIFTIDYERSIKGIAKTNTAYERWEIDGQYIKPLKRLQLLSFRAGVGFYSMKDKDSYFLDYTNFRENNIPGGWNDDWSGEFELLDSRWYNESDYYVRSNITYESPMMFISWIPWIGHFIETERIYASALSVKTLHPYIEYGYGFTTRLFSIGLFVANNNGNFDGFGCKIGFELFRHW